MNGAGPTREGEIAEYGRQYATGHYGMGERRQRDVSRLLNELDVAPDRYPSLLDIATGRGETLAFAEKLGFDPVVGTEVVEALLVPGRVVYAEAHELPFQDSSFDHVTCFDVLEHLVEADIRPALAEMRRVGRYTVTVSASSRSSFLNGRELHISARPVKDWEDLIYEFVGPAERCGLAGGSACWRIRL